MLSVVLGLLVCGAAICGMLHWGQELSVVLKGFLPLSFLMGGLVAVVAGLSSFGSKGKAAAQERGLKNGSEGQEKPAVAETKESSPLSR